MKQQLLSTLENSRKYTMAVAAAMPEKGYSFRPVESVWSFGELLNHIAYGIQWWESNFVKGEKMDWAPPPPLQKKAEIAKALEAAYGELEKTMSNFNGESAAGFHATLDHVTHHRGQAVTYLRIQGAAPPDYIY